MDNTHHSDRLGEDEKTSLGQISLGPKKPEVLF